MTRILPVAGALAALLALAAGCFSPATVQRMQQQSESYSISPDFDLSRTWRVAVLPPSSAVDAGNMTGLAEHAGMMLMRTNKIALVDRSEVDRILEEQQFASSGIVDPGTAARLGRLMGAEAVMVTSVTTLKHDDFFSDSPDQRDAQLYVKLVSVETSQVLYYAQGTGSSFEGAAAALRSATDVALAPLIRKGNGQ